MASIIQWCDYVFGRRSFESILLSVATSDIKDQTNNLEAHGMCWIPKFPDVFSQRD